MLAFNKEKLMQDENHEQHESVVQTLARYEQRIAELEAQLRQKDIQIEMHSDLSEHRQQKLEARLDAVEALYNKSPHYQKLYGPRTVVHFPPDHTVYVEFSRDELKKALEQKE
jgi:hypothetical protein